jgi:hypothetical protein
MPPVRLNDINFLRIQKNSKEYKKTGIFAKPGRFKNFKGPYKQGLQLLLQKFFQSIQPFLNRG